MLRRGTTSVEESLVFGGAAISKTKMRCDNSHRRCVGDLLRRAPKKSDRESVCVSDRVRERDCVCVSERESLCVCVRESVCVCVSQIE